jgi:HPt (histidine-containing phosphotransfer) domain-containing protein
MPAQPPSLAAATVRHLRELGGEELLRRLVRLLLELAPQRLSAVAEALEREDLAAARLAAHALSSTAGVLGAAALLDAAQVVETAGAAEIRAAAGSLDEEWGRLRGPLTRWLDAPEPPGPPGPAGEVEAAA